MEELKNRNKFKEIEMEKLIRKEGANYKPDITMTTKEGKNMYLDVTNRYEYQDFYEIAYKGKINKYKELLNKGDKIIPLIFGTRGAIMKDTIKELKKIGISEFKILKTISRINIRSSIEIINEHISKK